MKQPKLRFRDDNGKEFPEWKTVKLGELIRETNERSSSCNQYPVLSSTAQGLFLQSEYFNREVASADNTGYKVLRLNDLVFSPQNLWLGNINVNRSFEAGIVSPSYKTFSFVDGDPAFFDYFLRTPEMHSEYRKVSEQ